jgi:ATP-binding cassette subfamily F protein 3
VTGDERSVLDTVLAADVERTTLLAEEATLLAQVEATKADGLAGGGSSTAAHSVAGRSSTTAGASSSTTSGSNGGSSEPVDVVAAERRMRVIAARLEAIDAYSAEARASSILAGLQFTPDMQGWPTKSLSGGWRMRARIACALFVQRECELRWHR